MIERLKMGSKMHGQIKLRAMLLCAFAAAVMAAPESPGLLAQNQQQESTTRPAGEVEFVVESPPPHYLKAVTFDPIDLKQDPKAVRAFELMVRRELKKYPELIERSGLESFVLVQNLRVDGQERAQVPDRFLGRMYANPFMGAHDRVYQRHCVHHEFFHYLMERWTGDVVYPEPGWLALNPPGTRYGSGGVNARSSDQFAFTHPAPGFVNKYSQSAPEEDMCEIFATLHMPEEKRLVMQWAREDEVLRNKMKYMEELIERYLTETAVPAAEPTSQPAEPAGDGQPTPQPAGAPAAGT